MWQTAVSDILETRWAGKWVEGVRKKKEENDWGRDEARELHNDFNESTESPPDTLDMTPRNWRWKKKVEGGAGRGKGREVPPVNRKKKEKKRQRKNIYWVEFLEWQTERHDKHKVYACLSVCVCVCWGDFDEYNKTYYNILKQ